MFLNLKIEAEPDSKWNVVFLYGGYFNERYYFWMWK